MNNDEKPGRNDPCPCGSGRKYKQCCLNTAADVSLDLQAELQRILLMNPNLTIDELNAVIGQRVAMQNARPNPNFCGLSSNEIQGWFDADLMAVDGLTIKTPGSFAQSPIMCYFELMLDEALANHGTLKTTAKGNLSMALCQRASAKLAEFACLQGTSRLENFSFRGKHEGDFIALNYTRILATLAGILYLRKGRFHVKKAALKGYQDQGLEGFFIPMLRAAIHQFNWGYFDLYDNNLHLNRFWVFLLWRLQTHWSIDQLVEETITAFPALLDQVHAPWATAEETLKVIIRLRFLDRLLMFWGFIQLSSEGPFTGGPDRDIVRPQPLFAECFEFSR